ncbi:hypothetical protein ACIP3D_08655 [Streptomyces longwoodensis]
MLRRSHVEAFVLGLLVLVIERVTTLQGIALGDTVPAARLGQV